MKRWAYLVSIILGVYLAHAVMHRQQQVVMSECRGEVWVESPPAEFDPADHKLLMFDEQRPRREWTKVRALSDTVEQCQQNIAGNIKAVLATSDDPENVRRIHQALRCVCADDPQF